jgi:alpha-ketoglutarate-dependent taurine dioxygenase
MPYLPIGMAHANEGDIAFWDNRSTVHLAPTDIFESDFDRQLYRVTMVGKSASMGIHRNQ